MKATMPTNAARGIECRRCGCRHLLTTNTGPLADGRVRRRKRCRNCGQKIVTIEVPLGAPQRGNC